MADKNIQSRIINKHDTESNFLKATGFIPKAGELIVYDKDDTRDYERLKIGDGVTVVSSLPFASSTNDYTTDEKTKLAGIESGANKTTVDDALSATSTNPVQNKVVNTAISNLNTLVGDTAVSTQITNAVAEKADIAAGVYTVTAESSDGVAYTATVPGIETLEVGASFIMIPGAASTSKTPTLDVNGLGAKGIRRRLSNMATSLEGGYAVNWLTANKPFTIVYDGTYWVVEGLTRPAAADIYGTVPKAKADADGNVFTDVYATIAMLRNMLPKVTTITLSSTWGGSASPYYQDVELSCVTATSIVDLQPTPDQLASWQDDGLAFTTLSGDGTVRVYVAGGMPSSSITVQVKVQEVVEV